MAAHEQQVEDQDGEAATPREHKTLAQLFKAQALFEQFQALAPQAGLMFKLHARTQAERGDALALGLMTPAGREPVTLDAQDRFAIGGRYTVRGYDGEASLSAERGWLLRNDLSWAVGDASTRPEQAQVVIDFSNGTHS